MALCIRWLKDCSFSFSISLSSEYSGSISFNIDWFDLLAVQGTLKSLLQHHSSKASVLWHSAFFIVQLSHPYMATGKTIALTKWIFVSKMISLLFNMLSRCFKAFYFLILWLWSPFTMVLKPKKIKSVTASTNMGTTQKEILYVCVCVCVCVCVWASLVAQWYRISLATQKIQVGYCIDGFKL